MNNTPDPIVLVRRTHPDGGGSLRAWVVAPAVADEVERLLGEPDNAEEYSPDQMAQGRVLADRMKADAERMESEQ
jgi:hypothetical protein